MAEFKYGKRSIERLDTIHPILRQIFINVLNFGVMDISIIYGVREKGEQDRLFKEGLSKLKWPHSKHNIANIWEKSLAVDAAPFINGKASYNYNHCCYLAGLVMAESRKFGIRIRWGGDWDEDGEAITDQSFNDLLHFELKL